MSRLRFSVYLTYSAPRPPLPGGAAGKAPTDAGVAKAGARRGAGVRGFGGGKGGKGDWRKEGAEEEAGAGGPPLRREEVEPI